MAGDLFDSIFQVVQRSFDCSGTGVFIAEELVEYVVGLLDTFYSFLWISQGVTG